MPKITLGTVAFSALLLSAACGSSDKEASADRFDFELLFSQDPGPVDTVTRILIHRQRELFERLLGNDRSDIAEYLSIDFGWGTPPFSSINMSAGQAFQRLADGRPSGYFAVVAGFTPPPLDRIPTDYRVQLLGTDQAIVGAGPVGDGSYITTVWRRTSAGWRASQMLPVPKEYASREVQPSNRRRR